MGHNTIQNEHPVNALCGPQNHQALILLNIYGNSWRLISLTNRQNPQRYLNKLSQALEVLGMGPFPTTESSETDSFNVKKMLSCHWCSRWSNKFLIVQHVRQGTDKVKNHLVGQILYGENRGVHTSETYWTNIGKVLLQMKHTLNRGH